jgi:hypothetical protein
MTTHRPYPETPEAAARNARTARLSAYIDRHTVNADHARRARVRVAALHPPCKPFPDPEHVDAAIAATAPPAPQEPTP